MELLNYLGDFMVVLNKAKIASTGSFILNLLGSGVLIFALLPPFFETYKSRKTYAVTDKFFLYYTIGGICMFLNAVISLIDQATGGSPDSMLICLFVVFVLTNSVSITLNSYILKIKRSNMAAAAAMSMSEQDYYENVLKPQLIAEGREVM